MDTAAITARIAAEFDARVLADMLREADAAAGRAPDMRKPTQPRSRSDASMHHEFTKLMRRNVRVLNQPYWKW